MMSVGMQPPNLYVEGDDDICVISALMLRHGIPTNRGRDNLCIKSLKNADGVLTNMPAIIQANTDRPVGFVIDIDIEITDRWSAVCGRLRGIGLAPPTECPPTGYLEKIQDYPCRFGVWLMPDCATDGAKLEHLCESLLPQGDPLWPLSKESVAEAANRVDQANQGIADDYRSWKRFRNVDRIKAEVHTWLAWQRVPGAALGAAINDRILGHDSPPALSFLNWLKELYSFTVPATLQDQPASTPS